MHPTTTILLVDDFAGNRETLLELLDSTGYRLLEASNGPEALKLAAECLPDLLLLDVMMPGMDGFEVCRRIRSDKVLAELPVIMITALDDQESRLAGIEAGADDFITKPFNGTELRARVRTIARLNRYRRLMQAQEHIREQAELLDQARDAIVVRDLQGTITYWNRSAENLFGWTAEIAIGRRMVELFGRDQTVFNQALEKVLEVGAWTGELQYRSGTGLNLVIESRWTLLRLVAGHPQGIMTISMDVTESKKLEQQLLRAQRMESIGALAGGISHDLNNVLAPILMSIQVLRKNCEGEAAEQTLATIEMSAKRGANLVRQVLTFARGVQGEKIPLQLSHLIKEIETVIRETFPKSIQLRRFIREQLWTLTGDATQLHQVIMNLCLNARDAMSSGGTLTLEASNVLIDEGLKGIYPEAEAGAYVSIRVKDTGIGIPDPLLEKIFEPFFTTKSTEKGTGLGLSTVRSIVKSHGGFIKVLSKLNEGTEFRVFLPAANAALAPEEESPRLPLPSTGGELVLLVDDEAAILSIAKQTMELFGYRVLVASDGAQAIVLCNEHRDIKVIVADMMMPIVDGPSTIKIIRRVAPDIKIIAVTGSGSASDFIKSSDVEAFVQKPYTAERLLHTVHSVLNGEVIRPG